MIYLIILSFVIVFIIYFYLFLFNNKNRVKKENIENKILTDKNEIKNRVEDIKETKKQKISETSFKLPKELEQLENKDFLLEETKKNIETAMNEYDMDKETIIEMYKELEEQFNNQKKNIYDYLDNKNWELLEREIHSLKGATLNLKFIALGNPIKYIDDLLKSLEGEKSIEEEKYIKKYIDLVYLANDYIFKNI